MSDYFNDLLNSGPDNQPENTVPEYKDVDDIRDTDTQTPSGEYHYTGAQISGDDNAYSRYTNPYAGENQPQPQSYDSSQWDTPYSNAQYTAPQQGYPQYTAPQYAQPVNPYGYNTAPPIKPKKDKKGMSKGAVAILLVVCVLLSTVGGFAGAMIYNKSKLAGVGISTNGAMVVNKVEIDEQTAEKLTDKPTSQIADEVADTVVEITTEIMSTNSFYGQYISQGAGSGVIISSDGYIVTNNHVIDGASSITVTLRDKTSYPAQLVGKDSIVDVALLKIDAKDLKAANFGDSDILKVGDKAVAIGNPLGQLGGTVTDGIISALDRDVVIDDETMNLLQTDTAINPGNSGGGLFDGQGALVGVVVAKSSGEEIEGLGFAIPINDVIDIIDDLKEYGYVRGRVSVGMELIDLTNSMYAMYYYGNTQGGCYVYAVNAGSSAYDAGIQQGDRIVSVDGKEITTSADVEAALDDKSVGDVVEFEIERNGRTATVDVELEEYIPNENITQSGNDIFNPFG